MMKDKKLPTVERACPKCGNNEAHGPEFRRGVGTDEGLGEHLRFYCTTCRYMTTEPTMDTDTPERRAELVAAFAARRARPYFASPAATSLTYPGDKQVQRERDIESVRRGDMGRRPYGWQR